MQYPRFAPMGPQYPKQLEAQYDRILHEIDRLWESEEIHNYFSDLLIDKRGGRIGFPADVIQDIIMLREYHELETFRAAERKEDAIQQLAARGFGLNDDDFLRAFRAGEQELVDLYVRAKYRLPTADAGEPLLLAALKRGHTVVAKIVLEGGADVNLRNKLGMTPLLMACGKTTHGYRVIAEALIARGAQMDVRDVVGHTPLILAISGGMFDIAKLLIEHGANAMLTSPHGESPLELAIRSNDPQASEIIDMPMRKGGAAF